MNGTGLLRYASALVALAICSACGGALQPAQDGTAVAPSSGALGARYVGKTLWLSGRPVTAARMGESALPRFATLFPDVIPGRNREYIFNSYGSYASIFNYPKSTQQAGTLNGAGGQGCTNVLYGYGSGIVWNVAGATQITEYNVRKNTAIKTLSVSFGFPSSCAMDTSGDLAIGNLTGGQVAVFQNATGTPTVYSTPMDEEFFDGYDNQGNLFADGFTGNRSGFALVELPKGSTTFETIATSNAVEFPGSVQWDGKYLTVTDQDTSETYRYTVSGTKATLKSTVALSGADDCAQTWIVKGLIYCGDAGNNGAEVYSYPAGGSPKAILTGNFVTPLGVTAAEKVRK